MLILSYCSSTKTSSMKLRYSDSPWQHQVNGRIRAFIAITWLSAEDGRGSEGMTVDVGKSAGQVNAYLFIYSLFF